MAKSKKKSENNVQMEVDGSILTITIDLSEELRESETGKSTIVAATDGWENIETDEDEDNQFGIRLFVTKREKKTKKSNKD